MTITDFPGGQRTDETPVVVAAGKPHQGRQGTSVTQRRSAPLTLVDQKATDTQIPSVDTTSGHKVHNTQRDFAGPLPKNSPTTIEPSAAGPLLADPVLGLFADVVEDLELVRIANENRLRQLTDTTEHGHGLSIAHPQVKQLAQLVDDLKDAEHRAVLALQRAMRHHPLGPWVKATTGVGEKQAARLLALIRDPYWNDLHARPRLVSELWAYCGLHVVHPANQNSTDTQPLHVGGVAPTRRRGEKANWNSQARQRVWLIAESCVKHTTSPYRDVYDDARNRYADAVHTVPCRRCGRAGSPAAAGTPLSAGHQHARAMRLMSKEILRDLWRESARIHEERVK